MLIERRFRLCTNHEKPLLRANSRSHRFRIVLHRPHKLKRGKTEEWTGMPSSVPARQKSCRPHPARTALQNTEQPTDCASNPAAELVDHGAGQAKAIPSHRSERFPKGRAPLFERCRIGSIHTSRESSMYAFHDPPKARAGMCNLPDHGRPNDHELRGNSAKMHNPAVP